MITSTHQLQRPIRSKAIWMHNRVKRVKVAAPVVKKLGFYAALLTTLLTVVTFGIAIFTPPFSGPSCTANCFAYPYTDIVSRFPRDYIWMYPAMLLSLVYYVLMTCVHYLAPPDKRIFSHIGLSCALVSTAVLVINYFLQVSVIQPSLLNGETDGIALLSQFNPHGVFIVLEEVGFLMMSFSVLCMAPVFSGRTTTEKAIRWLFVANFVLTMLALTFYAVQYGIGREYRFEIAVITINWFVLMVAGVLLSVVFKRGAKMSAKLAYLHRPSL